MNRKVARAAGSALVAILGMSGFGCGRIGGKGLGDDFTFWQRAAGGAKVAKFSMVFERFSLSEQHPSMSTVRARRGERYVGVYATLRNLGPREGAMDFDLEMKTDKGYVYRVTGADDVIDLSQARTATERVLLQIRTGYGFGFPVHLSPGAKARLVFYGAIPEGTAPVAITGTLCGRRIRLRLE